MSKINYANKVALNVDPSVAAINKCQAEDMNSIKNAINQGGSFTPLTINTNTGVFYCSLEGTLATNDIVKVNVPTTIGNVTWYVSVDNDTTNYVVLYEDGTNVKPVDVSEKNVELYFNGTNFVLIGSAVQNAYSTSTTEPYSCSYVNNLSGWTYLTNSTAQNWVSLPSNWNELYIYILVPIQNKTQKAQLFVHMIKEMIPYLSLVNNAYGKNNVAEIGSTCFPLGGSATGSTVQSSHIDYCVDDNTLCGGYAPGHSANIQLFIFYK